MTERMVLLDAAAFMDAHGSRLGEIDAGAARTIAQRVFAASYIDCGKAPRLLDEQDLGLLFTEHLPRRFAARDPLVVPAQTVIPAVFEFVFEQNVVPYTFELRSNLPGALEVFAQIVAAGNAHADGLPADSVKTVRHRTEKTGRNDPCPCGSGKKFKKCCMQLGS